MIVGPVVPPPESPALASSPVVFGVVSARVGLRTSVLELIDGRRVVLRRPVPAGRRRVGLPVPPGRRELRLRAIGPGGRRTSAPVLAWVLPSSARRAGRVGGFVDAGLQRDVEALAARTAATTGVYVQHLVTGCGAAVNAGARFPAASTLKAGILVHAVRRGGAPASLLDAMILDSSDLAANDVIGRVGGPGEITETLHELGLPGALVRRPYIIDRASTERRRRSIQVVTTSQPALFTNFVISPAELARLMVAIHRGALGVGGVARVGIRPEVARRELMWRLLEVRDRSKLVAGVPGDVPVAHKTGYTTQTKHDGGILYLRSGPVVAAVMSWSASGVGDAAGDAFIASVARAARSRLAAGGSCASRPRP